MNLNKSGLKFCIFTVLLIALSVSVASERQTFDTVGTHQWQAPDGVNEVDILVVGGGGQGGGHRGGGGGSGEVIEEYNVPVTSGNVYDVKVGAGGSSSDYVGENGTPSEFLGYKAIGGGGGGDRDSDGKDGASGGGGGMRYKEGDRDTIGGTGVVHNDGGGGHQDGTWSGQGGGGGGYSEEGEEATSSKAGDGGYGFEANHWGLGCIAGGGGGGSRSETPGKGKCGGGDGNTGASSGNPGDPGDPNTGAGGGGGARSSDGGDGGSGIVIVDWESPGGDPVIEEGYRTEIDLEHDYSRIITSNGGSAFLTFRTVNDADEQKKLNTSLKGAEARFVNPTGDDWWEEYTLEPDSEKRFQVEIYEDSLGEHNLTIVTENMDYGLEVVEDVKINVRETPGSQVREVPGIEMIQLLAVLLFSTALYFASL